MQFSNERYVIACEIVGRAFDYSVWVYTVLYYLKMYGHIYTLSEL